jgi:uncharacterized coiled-coil protein SlyX
MISQVRVSAIFGLILLFPNAWAAEVQASHAKRKTPVRGAASTRQEIQELKALVAAQQRAMDEQRQQMERLRSQVQQLVDQQRQPDGSVPRVQSASEQVQTAASRGEKDAAEAQRLAEQAASNAVEAKTALGLVNSSAEEQSRRLSVLEALSSRFRLAGDIRVRSENLLQDLTPDRYRPRLRVRFGVEGKLNEDFTGGFSIATGTVNDDPVSTNNTLTQFFTRKPIGLDRGWITYQPQSHRWLQLTGGKFQATWNHAPITFDYDLNPEGFSEKLSFETKNAIVKNVSFTGLQLAYNEVAGSNLPFAAGNDSFAYGGQASVRLQWSHRLSTTFSGSGLNFTNADSIIQALLARTLAGNRNTNATITAGNQTFYASKFLYADFMADTLVKTGSERFPLRLVLDFVTNPRAASSQRDAFWGEAGLGKLQQKGDLQLGYGFGRVEQDAVIAAFVESEQRAPTNVLQHRIQAGWLVQKNTTLQFTGWFGRTLNRNLQNAALPSGLPLGENDPYVKRLQIDVIYKF